MPPGFPSDIFMPPASDENWKTACRNGQELSSQSNPLPCIFWSLKNAGSPHLVWCHAVFSALNPVLSCGFLFVCYFSLSYHIIIDWGVQLKNS